MLLLRVRCVDDGRELLLERRGAGEYSIQVAQLKKMILQQRHQLSHGVGTAAPQLLDLTDCFVLLRGQILADPDIVDLNLLHPSEFFVFAADTTPSGLHLRSKCALPKDPADSATFELLRSQLVEMGFSTELATQALQQSGSNLLDAVAFLAERKVGRKVIQTKETTHLEAKDSSITQLQRFIPKEDLIQLRKLAAMDSFRAVLLLKEQFSSEVLTHLNENPVATLRFLLLPESALSPSTAEQEPYSEDAIDVDYPTNMDPARKAAKDAIDRLVAMGFARDLVEIMYDSCGGNELLAANALLQTSESQE